MQDDGDGDLRFLLRRSGGSYAARSLRRSTRSGDGVGVANAKSGSAIAGTLLRIDGVMMMMIMIKN